MRKRVLAIILILVLAMGILSLGALGWSGEAEEIPGAEESVEEISAQAENPEELILSAEETILEGSIGEDPIDEAGNAEEGSVSQETEAEEEVPLPVDEASAPTTTVPTEAAGQEIVDLQPAGEGLLGETAEAAAEETTSTADIPTALAAEDGPVSIYYPYGFGSAEENFSHNLAYYVGETSSTVYSPQLAHMCMALACAAYDEEDLVRSMEDLGFGSDDIYTRYLGDGVISFALGRQTLADGQTLVLVTIRGTADDNEYPTNFTLGTETKTQAAWHEGYSEAAYTVYEDLYAFLNGDLQDTIFVVTGHSKGGAAANLLDVLLLREGVSSANVYGYNFACPDVAADYEDAWNPNGQYNNIFNIGNAADIVSLEPGFMGNLLIQDDTGTSWGKYGCSYWFSQNWNSTSALTPNYLAHYRVSYLSFLRQELPLSSYRDYEELTAAQASVGAASIGTVFLISGGTDVTVTDETGRILGSVTDGVVEYYASVLGDVMIVTCGEDIAFYVAGSRNLEIRINGTSDGVMDFTVLRMDSVSGQIYGEKRFSGVALTAGKTFSCSVEADSGPSDLTAVDVDTSALYVLDNGGNAVLEVQTDGSETEILSGASPEPPISDGILSDGPWSMDGVFSAPPFSSSTDDLPAGNTEDDEAEEVFPMAEEDADISEEEEASYSAEAEPAPDDNGMDGANAEDEDSSEIPTEMPSDPGNSDAGNEADHIPGDVNGDGIVNISDVQMLLKYVNHQDTESAEAALDVTHDGIVNISDVQLLLKYINHQAVTIF